MTEEFQHAYFPFLAKPEASHFFGHECSPTLNDPRLHIHERQKLFTEHVLILLRDVFRAACTPHEIRETSVRLQKESGTLANR